MGSPVDLEDIEKRFAAEHERTYGHRAEDDPVEVVHIRVEGRVASKRRVPAALPRDPHHAPSEVRRPAYFGRHFGLLETRVVDRGEVGAEAVSGPLIVEEYDATTLVPPDWTVRCDADNALVITKT
jgi:N-methylhydantoinase A